MGHCDGEKKNDTEVELREKERWRSGKKAEEERK